MLHGVYSSFLTPREWKYDLISDLIAFFQTHHSSHLDHVSLNPPDPYPPNPHPPTPLLPIPSPLRRRHRRPDPSHRRRTPPNPPLPIPRPDPTPPSPQPLPPSIKPIDTIHAITPLHTLPIPFPKPARFPPSPHLPNLRPHPLPARTKRHPLRIPPAHLHCLATAALRP